jgi:PAS domain S-box-containing protein
MLWTAVAGSLLLAAGLFTWNQADPVALARARDPFLLEPPGHGWAFLTALLRQPRPPVLDAILAALWLLGLAGIGVASRRDRQLALDQRHTLERLRASEERFSRAFALSPDALIITRLADGVSLEINEGFTRTTGYTRDEVLDRSFLRDGNRLWANPRDRDRLVAALAARGEVSGLEIPFLAKDGRRIIGLVSARAIEVDGAACILSLTRDITERKQAEELRLQMEAQLAHAQKMDSLGRLASGVAHDMNNVLMAIMGVADTLRSKEPELASVGHAVEVIQRAGGRGRDLVRNLTRFARNEIQAPAAFGLNRMVRDEVALLNHTLLQQVDVDEDLEEPLAEVLGDASALGSVLMNLCINAVDAMPDGGRLTIRTRSTAGGQVELSVQDTGTGMTPEIAAKAIEPFFTTKPVGKGTGLGLSMAYSTAKAHGGSLEIRSRPGAGTTVLLTLPALAAEPQLAAGAQDLTELRQLGVLVVDDEDLVRGVMAQMLTDAGHRVQAAAGGQIALDLLAQGPAPDLVLLDLNMPGLGGVETLRRLRRHLPRLPVLVCTGHLDPGAEQLLAADPHCGYIIKPFAMAEFFRAIDRVILLPGAPSPEAQGAVGLAPA